MAGHRTITDLSEVFYNGFKFPAALDLQIRSKMVYDDAERIVKWVEHRIRVRCLIHQGVDEPYRAADYSPTFPYRVGSDPSITSYISDQNTRSLRSILSQPAGHLVVNNVGYGGIRTINLENGDVNFGPKPQIISFDNQGAGRANLLEWECIVALPECGDGLDLGSFQGPLVQNRTHRWEIDERGLTTRTIEGYIEIPNNRFASPTTRQQQNNPNVAEIQESGTTIPNPNQAGYLFPRDDADAYRDLINIPVPDRFKRTLQEINLSLDHSRLDFILTDQEINSQNPYPKGVISITANQRTRTDNLVAGTQWAVGISADIELAPDTKPHLAWKAFADIVTKRRECIRQAFKKTEATGGTGYIHVDGENKKPAFYTREFEFDEGLFDNTYRFRVVWNLLIHRDAVFTASCFAQPLGINNWPEWADSIADPRWTPRGLADLAYDRNTDLLIGFCTPSGLITETEDPTSPSTLDPDMQMIIPPEKPEQSESWLRYRTQVSPIEETERIDHKILEPNLELPSFGPTYPADNPQLDGYTEAKKRGGSATSESKTPIIQGRSQPHHEVIIQGFAERIRFDIPKPVLISYAGKQAFPVGKLYMRKEAYPDRVNGGRMTRAWWYQRYRIDGQPGAETVKITPSPLVIT